jgi:hypothetical protein
MPDIQTAMAQALEQWNQPETTMTTSPPELNKLIKNNVSRETFNFVRDNPGTTRHNVVTTLGEKGFKQASVSSLLAQFIRDAQFKNQFGQLYAVNTEYRPLPQTQKRKPAKKIVAVKKPTIVAVPDTPKEPIMLVRRPMASFNAQEMVNRWSAYQAREVYQELKSIFGG